MRSIWRGLLVSGVLILSIISCATVPTEPLTSGELRLLSMQVPQVPMREDIKANFPFVVNINFEADGTPEIRTACFYWSGDGPYCFKVTDVNYGLHQTIKVQVRAKNSGSHSLESYVYYIKDGKVLATNVVGCHVRVFP